MSFRWKGAKWKRPDGPWAAHAYPPQKATDHCWKRSGGAPDHDLIQASCTPSKSEQGSPPPLPVPRSGLSSVPTAKATPRTQPHHSNVLLRPSGLGTWMEPYRHASLLCNFKILVGWTKRPTCPSAGGDTCVVSPLACYNDHLSMWSSLFLPSTDPCPPWLGPVSLISCGPHTPGWEPIIMIV